MKQSEAARLFASLRGAYPEWAINEATPSAYEAFLADLDYTEGAAAVKKLIATSKWAPKISEIRDAVFRRTNDGAAETAWESVMVAIRRHGSQRLPDFEHATMRTVEAMGGWFTGVCCWETRDLPAHRAHFLRLYEGLVRSDAAAENLGRLEAGNDGERLGEAKRVGELLPGGER